MKVIATTRQTQGTGASRRLRRADKLPGIIYGGNQPATMIELDHNPIYYALQKEKFHASVLEMELDGKEELVVLRAFQMHPYKQQVMHIDFLRVNANEPITLNVPLHFRNAEESPAVKVDKALINYAATTIELTCLPKLLPEAIIVDLSKMELGSTFTASMLELPEGVEFTAAASGEDPVLASVVAAVEEEIPAEDEAAADEAAAEAPAAEAPAAN